MLSKPCHGWTIVQIGPNSIGTASYIEDVPLDLLDAFIAYFNQKTKYLPFSFVFDAEGSHFGIIEFNDGMIGSKSISTWYQQQKERNESGQSEYFNLLKELKIQKDETEKSDVLKGKIFVITGDLHIYGNRKTLTEAIESRNGKVSGSISSKTNYLINNDLLSSSSKNKKAKELGIPIISEEEFDAMIL